MKKLFFIITALLAVIVITAGCVQPETPVVNDSQDLNGVWTTTSGEFYYDGNITKMPVESAAITMNITQDGRTLLICPETENLGPLAAMYYGKNKEKFMGKNGDIFVFGKVINGNQILLSSVGTGNIAVSSVYERGKSAPVEFPNIIITKTADSARGMSADGTAITIEKDFEVAILKQDDGIVRGTLKKDGQPSEFYGVIYEWNEKETFVFAYVPDLNSWVEFVVSDDIIICKINSPDHVSVTILGGIPPAEDGARPEFMKMTGTWQINSVTAINADESEMMEGIPEGEIAVPVLVISNQEGSLFSGTGDFGVVTAKILGDVSPDNTLTMFVYKSNGKLEFMKGELVNGELHLLHITAVEDGNAHSFVLTPVTA